MVPLATTLARRGHRVLWAVSPEFHGGLSRAGFESVAAGMGEAESLDCFYRRYPAIRQVAPDRRADVMFPGLFGAVRAGPMLADLLPAAAEWQPSVVVREAGEFAGPIAAAVLGVPSVTHGFGRLLPRDRVAAAGREVAPLWAAHGLAPRPYGGSYDHLYLDIYPPSLQSTDGGHVPVVQLLRPATAGPGPGPGPGPGSADVAAPLVYVTMGTIFVDREVLAMVVAAVRDLDVRVVVTVGPGRPTDWLGPQPPNVTVAEFIPQAELLPGCAVVVSHAGSGTFLAALAHGVPQVFLPQGADQFGNATAGAASGAGVAFMPGEATAAVVGSAVETMLSSERFRAAAGRLAAEIAAMPDSDEAAKRIEKLVGAEA
jgi:UDP:flavonoid glycosyltransferase YjiC (YdhE family)